MLLSKFIIHIIISANIKIISHYYVVVIGLNFVNFVKTFCFNFMFLKEYIQNKALKSINNRRVTKYKSLQEISSVALLFNFDEENIFETLKRLIEILDNRAIKFGGLGINNSKHPYPTEMLDHRIKVVNKSDLKYADVPVRSSVSFILDKEFDLFIDFGSKYFFANYYIAHSSKATFKIGRLNYKNNPYDLVLDNFKHGTARSYLNSLIHYLSSIESV